MFYKSGVHLILAFKPPYILRRPLSPLSPKRAKLEKGMPGVAEQVPELRLSMYPLAFSAGFAENGEGVRGVRCVFKPLKARPGRYRTLA